MDDKQFLIALIGILFSIISGVATGGYALLRQTKLDKVGERNKADEYRLSVDAATWQRANDIMDDLREQVASQGQRIKALEKALEQEQKKRRAAEGRIDHLEAENVVLREALANGNGHTNHSGSC